LFLNQKKNLKYIWRFAKSKYNEDFSYSGIRRHFKNHVQYYLDIKKEVDKERAKIIQRFLREDVYIAEKLTEHLKWIEEEIKKKRQEGLHSVKEEELALEWIESARRTIDQILRWKDKLILPEEPKEDIAKVVIECIKDFPPELIDKFTKRWEEYESRKKT
jgi:hypothetical protein